MILNRTLIQLFNSNNHLRKLEPLLVVSLDISFTIMVVSQKQETFNQISSPLISSNHLAPSSLGQNLLLTLLWFHLHLLFPNCVQYSMTSVYLLYHQRISRHSSKTLIGNILSLTLLSKAFIYLVASTIWTSQQMTYMCYNSTNTPNTLGWNQIVRVSILFQGTCIRWIILSNQMCW